MEEALGGLGDEEKTAVTRTFGTARQQDEEREETMVEMGRTAADPLGVEKTPLSGFQTSGGRVEDAEDVPRIWCCEKQDPLQVCLIRRRKTSMMKQDSNSRPNRR